MKRFQLAVIALLALGLSAPAYAVGMGGYGLTLVQGTEPSATPTPSVTPTPTATPTPGGAQAAVDPNIASYAQAELNYLYGASGVIQSAQLQFGNYCYANVQTTGSNFAGGSATNCTTPWSNQTSANGGQPLGAVGIDPSSINQGGGIPLASFGASSAADIMAKYAWGQGAIVVAHTDFMNPIVDWNNVANSGTTLSTACPGAGAISNYTAWGSIYDCNNTSGLSWDAYVQDMLTCPQSYCEHIGSATSQNANWNSELNLYVETWQDLQNSDIPVIVGVNQEDDTSALWYGINNIQLSTEIALRKYVEGYWEAQGIHNLLYAYVPIDDNGAWPGCGLVDITGWDNYSLFVQSSPYTYPIYTLMANSASSCGKPGMPQIWQEYGGATAGSFNTIDQTLGGGGGDPNVKLVNNWSIGVAGAVYPSTSIDSSWPELIENSYTIQLTGVAAGR